MIKVSIIVPVYNVEKYLKKCLDSLVKQTLKEIEILVINDGSPDNSQNIIDEYVEKYPKIIKSFKKKNGGLSSARNYGLKYATGEYISFVDSDDWLDLNALKAMYDLGKKENSDVVICDMIDHYSNYSIYHNCTKFNIVSEVTPSACNKIFKKNIIEKEKFIRGLWYEDLNFTTKLFLKKPKISTISKGYYNCHCRETSIMNNDNSLKNLDIIKVFNDIVNYAKKINQYDKNYISHLIFNNILITTINRVANQKSKDKQKVIKELVKYCKNNINDYHKQEFYKNIEKNRKIIAYLNYHNLYFISKLLLRIKSKLKGVN